VRKKNQSLKTAILILPLIAIFIGYWGLEAIFSTSIPSPKEKGSPPGLETLVLPSGSILHVEIAETFLKRKQGLMFRKHLPSDRGMLFFYPKPGGYRIWMKNCFISLDILWLNSNKEIIEMKENAPPCQKDPCPIYGTTHHALYILEAPSGTIKTHHLARGSKIQFKERKVKN